MDVWLQSALGVLPSLGIYGGFGWVLVLLIKREGTSEERHARELDRLRKAHDEELDEKNRDIERERSARRSAEDELRAQLRELRERP